MKNRNTFLRVWAALLAAAVLGFSAAAASAAPPAFTVSVSADGKTLVLTPVPPLKFRVMSTGPNAASGVAPVIVNGVADFIDWKLSVVFGEGPLPPPPPPPPPVKPVAVYYIHESGDLAPKEASVRDGLAWKKAADSLGIRWLCFDKDSGAKKFPDATKRATAAGLPAVVFIDAQGMPDVTKAPTTAAEMETLVKQKAGAK